MWLMHGKGKNNYLNAKQVSDSQNILHKFVRFRFVNLDLKILRLFRLKELFEADIIKE
jgi:hypothetical protein